jgi:tellurite resistance protein
MTASRTFFEAIGALVYAIAISDNEVEQQELKKMGKTFLSQFGNDFVETRGMRAFAKFEMLADSQSTATAAYDEAIRIFENCKEDLSQYSQDILSILVKISAADKYIENSEVKWINQFRNDISRILQHELPS